MENKNTVLALSLCVITLASLNMIQLVSSGRVLGDTTSTPIKTVVTRNPESQPERVPVEPAYRPEPGTVGSVSCTTLQKFITEYCAQIRPTSVIVPPIITGKTNPPTSCNPGVTKISYSGDCKARTESYMSLYTTANFICHDGYVGTVGGKTNACSSSADLSAMAKQVCANRGCPTSITRSIPKELDKLTR